MVGSDGAVSAVKFMCSYGGKILPRPQDGKLRYIGGENRVLAVDRCITFAELMVKMSELCGSSVSLRCKFPTEDLDALVSITSDEDLDNLIEEYDRASRAKSTPLKIRAFLWPRKSIKKISPPPSFDSSPAVRFVRTAPVTATCVRRQPFGFPVYGCQPRVYSKSLPPRYPSHSNIQLVANHWQ